MDRHMLSQEQIQRIMALNGAVFNRDAPEAARLYASLIAEVPDYQIKAPAQYDLARLLANNGYDELAYRAFLRVINHQRDHPTRIPSLREAGRLAAKLGEEERSIVFLLDYLDTNPEGTDRRAAEELLAARDQQLVAMIRSRRDPPVRQPPNADPFATRMPTPGGRNAGQSSIKIDLPEVPPPAPRAMPQPYPSYPPVAAVYYPTPPPVGYGQYPPPQGGAYAVAYPHYPQQPVPPMAPVNTPIAGSPTSYPTLTGSSFPPERPEQTYERLRHGRFAMILPLGKKIRLEAVAQLVAAREQVDEVYARKQVLRRKGVVFEQLDIDDLESLLPQVIQSQQALATVAVPRDLMPSEFFLIQTAELRDQGLKLTVEDSTVKRLRWDDIKLLNCGRINGRVAVTVVACNPAREFRFDDRLFDYSTFSPAGITTLEEGFLEILQIIASHCPHALHCQVVRNLLAGKATDPQVFDGEDEFMSYTHWALYSAYCESINLEEMVRIHRLASDW